MNNEVLFPSTPVDERKQKIRDYRKEYNKRPGVREKRNEHSRAYRRRMKKKKMAMRTLVRID